MTALAVVLAVTVPLLGPTIDNGPPSDALNVPTLEPVTLVEYVTAPDAPDPPPPVPSPVTVPPEATLSIETVASVVTPPPPPPPPVVVAVVQPPVAHVVNHDTAIARAKNAANGQLPRDALCPIWDGTLFRCDMAQALESAAAAGMPRVNMTDGYRSYADQVAVRASRGSWAAQPGTSNHGYGTAADVPEPARSWLFRHGADHGLINPAWAKNPNRTERWHWELAS